MTVNKIISGRTQVEWREDNNEKYKETNQKYRQENNEYLLYQKQIYRELNPDLIKRNSKEYYQQMKNTLLEKHLCGCGKYFTQCHKKRHEQTKKHQDWLSNKSAH